MDPLAHLCLRCGGTSHERTGDQLRCLECGTVSTIATITFERREPTDAERVSFAQQLAELHRHMAEQRRRMYDDMCRATFLGHALDGRWTGRRWLGGTMSSKELVTGFALAHGDDPRDLARAQVRVWTRIASGSVSLEGLRCECAVELVHTLWHRTGTLREPIRRAAFAQREPPEDPTAPWAEARLPIDGAPVVFRMLAEQEAWVALAIHRQVLVIIEAQAWPIEQTGLVAVPVTELAHYLAGSEALDRDIWGLPPG